MTFLTPEQEPNRIDCDARLLLDPLHGPCPSDSDFEVVDVQSPVAVACKTDFEAELIGAGEEQERGESCTI